MRRVLTLLFLRTVSLFTADIEEMMINGGCPMLENKGAMPGGPNFEDLMPNPPLVNGYHEVLKKERARIAVLQEAAAARKKEEDDLLEEITRESRSKRRKSGSPMRDNLFLGRRVSG